MNRIKRVIHAAPAEVQGYTGIGVTAAVLDTGFALHPDLVRNLAAFKDVQGKSTRPYDDSGHGTHVSGCLCGNGIASRGLYGGIAPDCRIVACKVLDENGEGSVEDMIAGIRYVLESRKFYHTRILNISVGIGKIEDEQAQKLLLSWLDEAWAAGLLVVVAAGNKGPQAGSISPLGLSSNVIAVGCHDGKNYPDKRNACENYSGRGPDGGRMKKPDIVSPGTDVISCNAFFKNTRVGVQNAYTRKSGTSMAVPAVSGAAALLWQKYPKLTNRQIKEKLLFHAQDLGENWGKQGWGMLHVGRALNG